MCQEIELNKSKPLQLQQEETAPSYVTRLEGWSYREKEGGAGTRQRVPMGTNLISPSLFPLTGQ